MNPRGTAEGSELRGLRAATLIEQGLPVAKIVRRSGSDPSSVRRQRVTLREDRATASAALPHPRPKLKLIDEQQAELTAIVRAETVAAGFSNDRWTTRRVETNVCDRFDVIYRFNQVDKLLKALDICQQKPRLRASQYDEQATEPWRLDA